MNRGVKYTKQKSLFIVSEYGMIEYAREKKLVGLNLRFFETSTFPMSQYLAQYTPKRNFHRQN